MLPVGDCDDSALREGVIEELACDEIDALLDVDALRDAVVEELVDAEAHGQLEGVWDCDALLVTLRE